MGKFQRQRVSSDMGPDGLSRYVQAHGLPFPEQRRFSRTSIGALLTAVKLQQGLSAMARFSRLAPQLQRLLCKGSHKFVRDHITWTTCSSVMQPKRWRRARQALEGYAFA